MPALHLTVALLVAFAPAPTRLHIVRHGETVANQTGKYTRETLNVFSERGEEQVRALTKKLLAGPKFDAIVVSPVPRAMMSIRPYLKEASLTADIWPAIAECCHHKDKTVRADAALPHGKPIAIAPDDQPYFKISGSEHARWFAPNDYAEGIKQVEKLAEQLTARFSGKGRRVLLVGHGIVGSLLIAKLLGRKLDLKVKLENGAETVLEEQPDGSWKMLTNNDRPVHAREPAEATRE